MKNDDNPREVTIRDLAAMLALSTATVSRALNDDSKVKLHTKRRVFELAEKLGYRSNDHAKNLRNGHSQTFGCIVPSIDNHQISTVIAGMENAARREEYCMVVMQSHGSADSEALCANILFNKRVDGLIVLPGKQQGSMENFRPFFQKSMPVVFVGHCGEDSRFVSINVDHRQAGYDMTRHLLAQGRRRIVQIAAHPSLPAFVSRSDGYRQALNEAGIPVKEQYMIKGGLSREDGMSAAEMICQWKQKPDAILAASDHSALGCILKFSARGFRVPDDIAIAGFDNDPVAPVTEPGLTSMSFPGRQMGDAAVAQLVHRLHIPPAGKMISTILFRSTLIVRGSTLNC